MGDFKGGILKERKEDVSIGQLLSHDRRLDDKGEDASN